MVEWICAVCSRVRGMAGVPSATVAIEGVDVAATIRETAGPIPIRVSVRPPAEPLKRNTRGLGAAGNQAQVTERRTGSVKHRKMESRYSILVDIGYSYGTALRTIT